MRTALITGAGTGIGKAAALALAKDGYHVALVGRRKELLEKTAAESGAGEAGLGRPADSPDGGGAVEVRVQGREEEWGPARRPLQQRGEGRAGGAEGGAAAREIPRGG